MTKIKKTTEYPVYSNDSKGPDPVDVYVGQRLREERIRSGVSQEKIADCTGVTFQQIQKYEMAKNRISASRLYQFSRILNVDIDYFFEGFESNEIQKMAGGLSDTDQDGFQYEDSKAKQRRLKEEGKVLETYFSLSPKDQKIIFSNMKSLSEK